MKTFVTSLLVLILLGTTTSYMRPRVVLTYYFSNSIGNDSYTSAQAQNPATPWKTLAKLTAWRLSGAATGDSLLLKRGDTWYEKFRLESFKDQVNVIDAYSTGNKPVISGFYVPTSWSSLGGNKYETSVPGGRPTAAAVVYNNIMREMGRYPNRNTTNGGYLTYTGGGSTSISGTPFTGTPNYTGYTVVVRKNRFIMDRGPITSQSGSTLNFTPTSHDGSTSGWGLDLSQTNGFFLQNSYDLLDAEGEWYYNDSPARLDLYTALNPATQNIKISVIDTLAFIYAQNNLKVRNIRFEGSNMETIRMNNDNYCTIQNCDFYFNGLDGARVYSCTNILWDGNFITYSGNNSAYFEAAQSTTISNSRFEESGVLPGMGKSNGLAYLGIILGGNSTGGNIIQNCIINNVGYNAIHMAGNNNTIYHNYINGFNKTLDDGGGVYSSYAGYPESGRVVRGNVITNGLGNAYGTVSGTAVASSGIYFDDRSSGATIDSNKIAYMSETGIYCHNSSRFNIFDNLVYGCPQLWRLNHDALEVNDPIRQINMQRNFFFAPSPTQEVGHYYSIKDDLQSIGTIDNNFYSRPKADNTSMFFANQPAGNTSYTFSQWTHAYHDMNSKPTPAGIVSADSVQLILNPLSTNSLAGLGSLEYVNLKGQGFTKTISIPAYGGYLLLRKNLDKAIFRGRVTIVP